VNCIKLESFIWENSLEEPSSYSINDLFLDEEFLTLLGDVSNLLEILWTEVLFVKGSSWSSVILKLIMKFWGFKAANSLFLGLFFDVIGITFILGCYLKEGFSYYLHGVLNLLKEFGIPAILDFDVHEMGMLGRPKFLDIFCVSFPPYVPSISFNYNLLDYFFYVSYFLSVLIIFNFTSANLSCSIKYWFFIRNVEIRGFEVEFIEDFGSILMKSPFNMCNYWLILLTLSMDDWLAIFVRVVELLTFSTTFSAEKKESLIAAWSMLAYLRVRIFSLARGFVTM
jgi:hypothetical protein